MSILKVTGKFTQSSGLSDIWSQNEVLRQNRAINILQAKVGNRVRAHKLTYEALYEDH